MHTPIQDSLLNELADISEELLSERDQSSPSESNDNGQVSPSIENHAQLENLAEASDLENRDAQLDELSERLLVRLKSCVEDIFLELREPANKQLAIAALNEEEIAAMLEQVVDPVEALINQKLENL